MDEQPYELLLYDIKGSRVWQEKGKDSKGENGIIVPLMDIAKGIYTIVLQKGDKRESTKLIVE